MTTKMIGPPRRSSGQMERRSLLLTLTLHQLPISQSPRSCHLQNNRLPRKSLLSLHRSQPPQSGQTPPFSNWGQMLNVRQELQVLRLRGQMTKPHRAPQAQHHPPSRHGPPYHPSKEFLQSVLRCRLLPTSRVCLWAILTVQGTRDITANCHQRRLQRTISTAHGKIPSQVLLGSFTILDLAGTSQWQTPGDHLGVLTSILELLLYCRERMSTQAGPPSHLLHSKRTDLATRMVRVGVVVEHRQM
jgi:hypothetical protein